ncbi:hypothetical protein [Sphingosinicella ginsenosidimutans]|uniref:hypothetical protein n=1 Tax=Allosphingosinicella ginsenosidimutans TaxID=1176539 RepID=UPI0013151954|nr:hypothetical protein [Sphingosinicella ginsenosidimutans]
MARFERSGAFESAVGIFARQTILFFAGTLPSGGREIGDCADLIVPRFAPFGEKRFFAPRRGCLRIDEAHIRERRTGGMVAMIGFLGSTKSGGGKHAVSFQQRGGAFQAPANSQLFIKFDRLPFVDGFDTFVFGATFFGFRASLFPRC